MSDFSLQILDLLGIHRAPVPKDWVSVESVLGAAIPADYKSLLDTSGAAVIDEYLTIFEPQSNDPGSDLLTLIEERESAWSELAETGIDLPEIYFRSGHRLFAFAAVESNYFFWHAEPGVSADEWGVVLVDADVAEWHDLRMSATECLYKVLTGELDLDPFEDLFRPPHSVETLN